MARYSNTLGVGVLLLLIATSPAATAQGKTEKFEGYAEWRQDAEIIVDGQRVRATAATKFKGTREVKEFGSIPLGYELKVTGTRRPDGIVDATSIDAKPNGTTPFEVDIVRAFQQLEAHNLDTGRHEGRRLLTRGPQVDRVKRIATRLIPPYKSTDDFRFYVVEDGEWNAAAAANGMILVYQGLLRDMDDDEVALVLGHELVHATHEHSRREAKRGSSISILSQAAGAAASVVGGTSQAALLDALGLTVSAMSNGYGRDLEDQADRVGLRYAHEAGFDVTKATRLWNRFGEKYGQTSKISNFFHGDHSLSSARAKNLRRQIVLNYPLLLDKLKAAEDAADARPEGNDGTLSKSR